MELPGPNTDFASQEPIIPIDEDIIHVGTDVHNVGIPQPQQDMDISKDEPMTLVPTTVVEHAGDTNVVDVKHIVADHDDEDSFEPWRVLHRPFNDLDVHSTVAHPQPHPLLEAPPNVNLASFSQNVPHVSCSSQESLE